MLIIAWSTRVKSIAGHKDLYLILTGWSNTSVDLSNIDINPMILQILQAKTIHPFLLLLVATISDETLDNPGHSVV